MRSSRLDFLIGQRAVGARNVSRSDRLMRPSGTPLPWYRSNSTIHSSVAGAAARIVPRTAAAGKASSTRIEMSRTIAGNFGSVSARRSRGNATRGQRVEVDLGDVDLLTGGNRAPRRSTAASCPITPTAACRRVAPSADRPRTRYGASDPQTPATLTPSAAQISSDGAFHVEEVDGLRAEPTSAGRAGAGPCQRDRAPFPVRA